MTNNFQEFYSKLSQKQKELLEKSKKIDLSDKNVPIVTGELKQVSPNIIREQNITSQIQQINVDNKSIDNIQIDSKSSFIVEGFYEFYTLIKSANPTLNERVINFISFIDEIPKRCGCVRGALNESAQSMYAGMLPLLQVELPDFFSSLKSFKQVDKMYFKDKTMVIFEI